MWPSRRGVSVLSHRLLGIQTTQLQLGNRGSVCFHAVAVLNGTQEFNQLNNKLDRSSDPNLSRIPRGLFFDQVNLGSSLALPCIEPLCSFHVDRGLV